MANLVLNCSFPRLLATVAAWACLVAIISSTIASEPIAEQKRIAEGFAAKCVGSKVIYDTAGNVIKLAISRHLGRPNPEPSSIPPGVGDIEFAQILKLPHLEAVFIEKMPLSDASYALLGQLRQLQDVRIHYPSQSTPLPNSSPFIATDRFAQFLNQHTNLRVLQLKHIFGMQGDGMIGLEPQPALEHLEIDTVCAKASAVPFIVAAPKLRNLQVHRCEWTDAELQRVLAALPELEVLELKPAKVPTDPITGRSLRGLSKCPKLKLLQLVGHWTDLSYEQGFEALVGLKALQQLNVLLPEFTTLSPAIQRLHRARPDVLIKVGNQILGGQSGQKLLGVDDGYDWGGAVTTHG